MSAIAGEVSFNRALQVKNEQYEEMKKALIHRGKEFQANYLNNTVSIIQNSSDKSDGGILLPYSLRISENKYIITYDGKLSNKDEIRCTLSEHGIKPESDKDYEYLILLYSVFGKDMLDYINGVFAFAIWDVNRETMFFARDRLGVRPFFYTTANGNFVFSSEIKGIFSLCDYKAVIDFNSVMEIMLIGPGRTLGYGVFKGINELPPAYCGTYTKEGLKTERYWSIPVLRHTDSVRETVKKVRALVEGSIMNSIENTEVCTMLSGGLDSSIITSVVSKVYHENGKKLKPFSVSYKDNDKYFTKNRFQPASDSDFIKSTAKYLGVDNEVIELSNKELLDAVYDAVDARDLPGMADIDSSLLLFCKKIREQYDTALSGECSDEIFGGYPWYRDPKLFNYDGFPWAHSTEFRKQLMYDELTEDFDCQEYVYSKYANTVNRASKLDDDPDARKKELMQLNLDWFMMTLVDRTDRMSGQCSLDVRVPFCDYKIVEYLYNVKWEYKDLHGFEKGLLREAFQDMLPDNVLWRKKSPYPKTHNPEYLYLVRNALADLADDSSAPIFKFIKRKELIKLLYNDIPQNFYGQLMTTPQTIAYILQINYWLNKYAIDIEL